MNLDKALVAQAAEVLGTRGSTETVHAARESVDTRARRPRLASRDLPDLTPETLAEIRAGRTARL
jgi:hypothetical protein